MTVRVESLADLVRHKRHGTAGRGDRSAIEDYATVGGVEEVTPCD